MNNPCLSAEISENDKLKRTLSQYFKIKTTDEREKVITFVTFFLTHFKKKKRTSISQNLYENIFLIET